MRLRQFTAIALLAVAAALLWYAIFPPSSVQQPSENATASSEAYALRDWSDGRSHGENKISAFTFRDRNRNGIFDPDDLPMAGVLIDMERPDGIVRTRSSNINGYTNFTMSFEGKGSDITEVRKDHQFRVRIPPGFDVTTGNTQQTASFSHLPGAIANIVADNPPKVVGLAPRLTISGRVSMDTTARDTALIAHSPDGVALKIQPDTEGRFSFDASVGDWILQATGENGASVERRVAVVDAPVVVSALEGHPPFTTDAPDKAFTEDFEFLQRSVIDKIANGHAGLNWDYLLAVDNQYYGGPGYVNTLTSGRVVAYNSSGHPVTITASPGESFTFKGAYFGIAWPAAEGETLHVEAWRGAESVGREELRLSHLGPVWFDADYRGIDRLHLKTSHYWQFVIDDMQIKRDEN